MNAVQPLSAVPQRPPAPASASAERTVQEFEAVLLRQMFQKMRQFSWSSGTDPSLDYRSLGDDALASQLAQQDALGLRKTLLPLLEQIQYATKSIQKDPNDRIVAGHHYNEGPL